MRPFDLKFKRAPLATFKLNFESNVDALPTAPRYTGSTVALDLACGVAA